MAAAVEVLFASEEWGEDVVARTGRRISEIRMLDRAPLLALGGLTKAQENGV